MDMTLAQMRAYTEGHVSSERSRTKQLVHAIRAALTAEPADLDRMFAEPATAADLAAAEAETLAAFGISEAALHE
jgi:hypothetical protein